MNVKNICNAVGGILENDFELSKSCMCNWVINFSNGSTTYEVPDFHSIDTSKTF